MTSLQDIPRRCRIRGAVRDRAPPSGPSGPRHPFHAVRPQGDGRRPPAREDAHAQAAAEARVPAPARAAVPSDTDRVHEVRGSGRARIGRRRIPLREGRPVAIGGTDVPVIAGLRNPGPAFLPSQNRDHRLIGIMHRDRDVFPGEDGYISRRGCARRNIFAPVGAARTVPRGYRPRPRGRPGSSGGIRALPCAFSGGRDRRELNRPAPRRRRHRPRRTADLCPIAGIPLPETTEDRRSGPLRHPERHVASGPPNRRSRLTDRTEMTDEYGIALGVGDRVCPR